MLNFSTSLTIERVLKHHLFHFSVNFRGQIENGPSLESSYDKGSSFHFKLGQGKPPLVYRSRILLEKVELGQCS